MSQHVPDDLLHAFIDGDMGEQLAIHIADHLDSCPSCATQAAHLEPLATVFASVDDPEIPDLVGAVFAELDESERIPVTELTIGGALIGLATMVAMALGDPMAAVVQLGVLADIAPSLSQNVVLGMSMWSLATSLLLMGALAGTGFAARAAFTEKRV
jgi:anti-sigma factor RsiW